ncbi:hypothetical protein E2C01_057481 [Portunus trituberculatus]|uniref:Uncharacterized protein n=1 Tax=Portunus trituberculatus TaxID=210409 RepID=A0A5B7H043_PORTR|nr:hypothetical protein [Portunus trituberculatus]
MDYMPESPTSRKAYNRATRSSSPTPQSSVAKGLLGDLAVSGCGDGRVFVQDVCVSGGYSQEKISIKEIFSFEPMETHKAHSVL